MRKRWKLLWSAVGAVLLVLSLVDVPDQIAEWANWLEPLQGDLGRWLVALAGLLVIVMANHEPLWAWIKRQKSAEADSAPSPIEETHQPRAVGAQPEQPAEPESGETPEQAAKPEREPPEPPRERRRREAIAFREAFDTFMDTFLERRREADSPLMTHERFAEMRDEYRFLQRTVVAAYRPVKDPYLSFLIEEPRYDLRDELYEDNAPHFPPDHPLTDYWSALTLDEARMKWSDADDARMDVYLERDRAVLDAFVDWTSEERPDDFLAHLPHHYREVVRMRRQGYRETTIAQELDLDRRTIRKILDDHYRD